MDRTLTQAGRRFGAGLLVLVCIGGIGLWQVLRSDAPPGKEIEVSTSSDESEMAPGTPVPGVSSQTDQTSLPAVSRVEPRQLASFSVLRTPPEALPATIRNVFKPGYGLNWKLAQRLPVSLRGNYWAVPGHGWLCLLSQTPLADLTCTTTAQAVAHGVVAANIREAPNTDKGVFGVSRARGRRLIVGIAPDGAREMRIESPGSTTTTPVVDGIFILRDRLTNPPDNTTPL